MGDTTYANGSNGALKRHIVDEEPPKPGSSGDLCDDFPPCPKHVHVCHVMSNLDNIIRHVFEYLPIRSLHNVARVCHKWHELVKLEKKCRRQVYWTLAEIHRTHQVLQFLTNPILNSYSQPVVAFLFVTQELFEKRLEVPRSIKHKGDYHSGVRIVPKRQRRRMSVMSYMQTILPTDCKICGVVVDGVIGTYHNTMYMNEVENNDAIVCLMFPVLQNVAINRFYFNETNLDNLHTARGDLRAVTDMPDDHEAVLTLLFYESAELSMTPLAPARVILENTSCRVVAGAFVRNRLIDNHQNPPPLLIPDKPNEMDYMFPGLQHDDTNAKDECQDVTGVVFSVPAGTTDVKVASVFFDEDVDSELAARTSIARLKQCHIPERNTVAFLMACCSRGEHHYGGKANVESFVFHQLFPKVPLVGVFGQGEICHEYLPDYAAPPGCKGSVEEWAARPVGGEQVHYSMCSGIVLLHLGDQGGRSIVV